MMLSASHGVVRIELSPEERVILHLAKDIPLPETPWDRRAAPRTVDGIARSCNVAASTAYRILERLRDDGTVYRYPVKLQSPLAREKRHVVHVLTEDGKMLAEAIRARAGGYA